MLSVVLRICMFASIDPITVDIDWLRQIYHQQMHLRQSPLLNKKHFCNFFQLHIFPNISFYNITLLNVITSDLKSRFCVASWLLRYTWLTTAYCLTLTLYRFNFLSHYVLKKLLRSLPIETKLMCNIYKSWAATIHISASA